MISTFDITIIICLRINCNGERIKLKDNPLRSSGKRHVQSKRNRCQNANYFELCQLPSMDSTNPNFI